MGPLTWHQAKEDAERRGGHLATITSEEEFNYILSLGILPTTDYWLGGTDELVEGEWRWVTGEPWSYTRWFPGEPNDNFGEDYVVGALSIGHRWNDVNGTTAPAYLLEIDSQTLSILTQPTNRTAVVGSTASFAVIVAGRGPVSYQWYFGETLIPEGTNRVLNLANVGFAQTGGYRVVATNGFSSVTSRVATLTVVNPPARVRIASVESLAGGTVELPIQLIGNGDENGIGFSIQFDKTRLAFASVVLGADAADASLLVNSNAVGSGKIGLAIALPTGQTFPAGTQQVARLTLTVAPAASVFTTPLTFGDDPVLRQLSNVSAGLLSAIYVDGAVSVLPSTVRAAVVQTVSGGSVSVPITLLALGNENGVSFSATFDRSVLSLSGIQPGAALPADAAVLVNTNLADSGRVGVSVVLASGTAFTRGFNELVQLEFEVATVLNPLSVQIGFGDSPTLRQISNPAAQPLPGAYQPGSVEIVSVAFEGDIAPRPGGDRVLSIIDWVQAGRFAAALDTVDAEEFQRVDCAPRSTRGNGVISVADWVQTGRYSVGLDPLTGMGGPTEPAQIAPAAVAAAANAGVSCQIRITNTNVLPGQTLSVPLLVTSMGIENALGFSVTFDPSKLRYTAATKLAPANLATMNLNTSQALSGRLGIALALPIGSTFAAGSQEIVLLTFEAPLTASGTTMLGFGDSPVLRETVSATANTIPSSFTGGQVTLGPPTPIGPPLGIVRSGDSILLFWSTTDSAFELYAADAPLGSAWTKVPASPLDIGDQKIVTVPRSGEHKYFRLRRD